MVFEVGSLVKLGAAGVSVFRVVALDDDGNLDRVIIEPVADAPGGYPFPMSARLLVPVDG